MDELNSLQKQIQRLRSAVKCLLIVLLAAFAAGASLTVQGPLKTTLLQLERPNGGTEDLSADQLEKLRSEVRALRENVDQINRSRKAFKIGDPLSAQVWVVKGHIIAQNHKIPSAWAAKQFKPIPNPDLRDNFNVSIQSTGRQTMICLLPQLGEQDPGMIGLDLDGGTNPDAVAIEVNLRVIRTAGNQKVVIGTQVYHLRNVNAGLPLTTFQMIDRDPPLGECRYSIEAQSVKGDGILTISDGARLAAWEL